MALKGRFPIKDTNDRFMNHRSPNDQINLTYSYLPSRAKVKFKFQVGIDFR